jgi:hypothetical protein
MTVVFGSRARAGVEFANGEQPGGEVEERPRRGIAKQA